MLSLLQISALRSLPLGVVVDLCSLGIEGLCLPLGHFMPGVFPLPWLGSYLGALGGEFWRHVSLTWALWCTAEVRGK